MCYECFYMIFIYCVGINTINSQKGPCIDENPHGCCPETIWNETLGRCSACGPGYIGQFCNDSCEYPYHGWNCKGKCSCNRTMCHYLTGCEFLETSTARNKNAADLDLPLNATVLTTTLDEVWSGKVTTVGHSFSSHVMESIDKEHVIKLRIEHKLIIVFAVLLVAVLTAYFILTLYEHSMRYETHGHSYIVYYGEGSVVDFRL